MIDQRQEERPEGASGGEQSGAAWRNWASEIQADLVWERNLLLEEGARCGLGPDTLSRILSEQEGLAEMVRREGKGSFREFARSLAAHLRFQEEFFRGRPGGALPPDRA